MSYKLIITKDTEDEIKAVLNGSNWWRLVYELDSGLRNKLKYGEDELSEEKQEAFEEVRKFIYEFMSENRLNLFEE